MMAVAFAVFLAFSVNPGPCGETRMIAHRGGVVDGQHAEGTLAALQEAVRQGYWMAEVDVQRSRDGELVVQHDDNYIRVYGVNKKVADLDWKDVRLLRSRIGGQPPCSFAEYAEQCRGRISVMIDGKITGGRDGLFEKMEEILRANDLLSDALFIGSGEMKAYFKGKARIAVNREELKRAVDAGEDVASLYFLFEHGNELDDAAVKQAQSVRVPVVASVNDFHYILKRRKSTPRSDIERLRGAGVTLFQIDSAYAGYCRQSGVQNPAEEQ